MTASRHSGDKHSRAAIYASHTDQWMPFRDEERHEGSTSTLVTLKKIADVILPTRWADFNLLAFEGTDLQKHAPGDRTEAVLALSLGDIHRAPPLVRIHSQCTTGEVFHSMRCDCYEQLHLALRTIAEQGAGVLVYEHQEGRGIGLLEKLRAYELQDQGLDTIEANLRLGHAVDLRNYALSVEVLRLLAIRSLRLMTNNPDKIHAVRSSGIEIVMRVSADVPANPHSTQYLATKRDKLGHLFNSTSDSLVVGSHSACRASRLPLGNIGGRPGPTTLHLVESSSWKG
jgi:GTP cyclohydrolase II